jgi:hypothetical protein
MKFQKHDLEVSSPGTGGLSALPREKYVSLESVLLFVFQVIRWKTHQRE